MGKIPNHPDRSDCRRQGRRTQPLFALRPAFLVLCLLSAFVSAQTSEQDLTGQIQTAQGMRRYTVRLLPPASFPALPQKIAVQLNEMHCMVPQTFEAHHPENVIHGSFEKKGSEDWAVLCAHDAIIDLFAFFSSAPDRPLRLATHGLTERMGADTPASEMGSAWGITAIPADGMAHTPGVHQHGPFEHDGIEDDFVERSSVIHYYRAGNWLTLEGNN